MLLEAGECRFAVAVSMDFIALRLQCVGVVVALVGVVFNDGDGVCHVINAGGAWHASITRTMP